MLHTGRVQLGNWYERPALGIALNIEERVHGFWRSQVMHVAAVPVAALQKALLSGLLFWRCTFLVRISRLRSAARRASESPAVWRWLSEEV